MQSILIGSFGVIAALLALLTAWIGYRQKLVEDRSIPAAPSSGAAKVVVVQIERERPRRWPWVLMKWSTVPIGGVSAYFTVHGIFLLFRKGNVEIVLSTGYFGLCTAAYVWGFKRLRHEPWLAHSIVRRSARVTVQGTVEATFDRCVAALRPLGGRVNELNRISHLIAARVPWTWRSLGEKINVKITPVDASAQTWQIEIVSDSILPLTLVDFGKNALNVQRFLDNIQQGGNPSSARTE